MEEYSTAPESEIAEAELKESPEIAKLRRAISCSYKSMSHYRKSRLESIKMFVGPHYTESEKLPRQPINLLALAVTIYTRQLAARNPRVMVASKHMALKPSASKLELALNHLLGEIAFNSTMKSIVLNALFGAGVVKIGQAPSGSVEIDGILHDVGQPFADSIDLEDFVIDMTASRLDRVQFIGDRYCLPLSVIQEAGIYDQAVVEKLKPQSRSDAEEGMEKEPQAKDMLGGQPKEDDDEYSDKVYLWDIYLPRENRMLTLVAGRDLPPLLDQEWTGPEGGPYRIFGFQEVPNNVMPIPPVMFWRDLHEGANNIFRKLQLQAERQKSLYAYRDSQDAEKVRNAGDGEMIQTGDPNSVIPIKFGGPEQVNIGWSLNLNQQFNRQAGNLDTMGGLAAGSDTVGQDKLLADQNSKMLAEMADRVMDFVRDVCRDLGWYMWHNPLIEIPLVKEIAGMQIETTFSPEDREGDFYDYNIAIQPYSMADETPNSKLQKILTFMERVVMPMAPMMQQIGIMPNPEGFLRAAAKAMNLDEFEEMITIAQPVMPQEGPVQPGAEPAKPANTTRTYERVNRPGATQQGKDQVLMEMMMGGNPQPKEQASLARGVS